MNTTSATPSVSPAAPNASAPAPAPQPTYDSGLRFDSGLRYALGDTPLPVDDGGVIKFSPSTMKAQDLLTFSQNENEAITGNALFPTPVPSVADLGAALATFQADVTAWDQAQIDLRNASTKVEGSQAVVTSLMKMRANYVQCASNGNTNAIVSAGFEVRNSPTPVGELNAPVKLLLTLNGTPGVMYLEWEPVVNARAYNIQVSPADTMERTWEPIRTSTTVRQKFVGLELGKVYAFRVAAVGGASGLSDWSAEVVRMAA